MTRAAVAIGGVFVDGLYLDVVPGTSEGLSMFVYRSPLGLLYFCDCPDEVTVHLGESTRYELMEVTARLVAYREVPAPWSSIDEQAAAHPQRGSPAMQN